jgi:hypothetical protein
VVITKVADLTTFTSGATFGPPAPAHFAESGPITVSSGTATPFATGPNYGNVDSLLLPTGLPTDAFLANVTVSQTIATNPRVDGFGDLNGTIINNAANSGALGVTGSSPPVTTPEPASMAVLGMGLAGMALLRRRQAG